MRSAGGYPPVSVGCGLASARPSRVSARSGRPPRVCFGPGAPSQSPDYDSRTFRPTASPNAAAPVAGSRS